MERLIRKFRSDDDGELAEKHFPVVEIDEENEEGFILDVQVGEVLHPSDENHFIQWIELSAEGKTLERIYLTEFVKPKVSFFVKEMYEGLSVRLFCNVHGFWENKMKGGD